MQNLPLTRPTLGVTICGKTLSGTFGVPGHQTSDFTLKLLKDESTADIMARVRSKLNLKDDVLLGFSHHGEDIDTHEWPGFQTIVVSPTVATLGGIPYVSDRHRTILKDGTGEFSGNPLALLKIGPLRVTTATQGDLKPQAVRASTIFNLSEEIEAVYQELGEELKWSPIDQIGNQGWSNMANYFARRASKTRIYPDSITTRLIQDAVDPASRRVLVSRLCSIEMDRDPFCAQVATAMVRIFGRLIGEVANSGPFGTLYVQYNAISAVSRMPLRVACNGFGDFSKIIEAGDPDTEPMRRATRVVLTSYLPQFEETRGAMWHAASQDALIAA